MQKVTKKQAELFYLNALQWLNNHPEENKLTYALKKVSKKIKSQVEDFQEEVAELRLDYASLDKDGNLKSNPDTKGYEFKPDKLKEFNKKLKELGAKEIEVETYIATKIPDDLPYEFREIFTPFVIKEVSLETEPEK